MTAAEDIRRAKGSNEIWLACELSVVRWWAQADAPLRHREWQEQHDAWCREAGL